MSQSFTFTIYKKVNELPSEWDDVAQSNAFLQKPYLTVLEHSAPTNMQCFFIGIFDGSKLIGTSLAQYLDLNSLESFGERDQCIKTWIRNFIFKNFASHVIFIGNNMITGQNGFVFSQPMNPKCISDILRDCSNYLIDYFKSKNVTIHIISFKDFYRDAADSLKNNGFDALYEFNAQPNMIFHLRKEWKNKEDYIAALTKKYRDQYKRAQKKSESIYTRELSLDRIIHYEKRIYELYYHVAKNAPFNTFFLAEDHFSTFKKQCGDNFVLVGYFKEEKLIGFHSLLLNNSVLETYFLGYDNDTQKDYMLYLNMLYNMTFYGITKGFEKIIFGRTALEIKNSIGAKPIYMSGFIYHTNKFINKLLPKIFPKLEPATEWHERHPFKDH